MATETAPRRRTSARIYDATTQRYLEMMDASIKANERLAHIARVWIDEMLALQKDMAEAARRTIEETRATFEPPPAAEAEHEAPRPGAGLARAGEVARATASMWTETSLKAIERFNKVAQTAMEEVQATQTELTTRLQERRDKAEKSEQPAGAKPAGVR